MNLLNDVVETTEKTGLSKFISEEPVLFAVAIVTGLLVIGFIWLARNKKGKRKKGY